MIDTIAYVVGWTLIHSLWQGAAIAGVTGLLLAAVPRGSARVRYAILCVALFAHLAAPLITAAVIAPSAVSVDRSPFFTSLLAPPAGPPSVVAGAPSASRAIDAGNGTDATTVSSLQNLWSRFVAAVLAGGVERFLPLAVAVWMIGVFVSALRRIGAWFWLRRLVARATPAGAAITDRVSALAGALGIRRRVRVLVSGDVTGPFTSGWLRPVIVMPLTMLSGLDPVHVDAILTHELAHVRRWDYLVAIVQSVALTVLFHHPVTWWLDRKLRVEREYCCDDLAVAASRDRVGYVRALAELESLRLGLPSLALAATDGSLEHRVVRLLSGRTPASPGGWVPAAALVSVVLAVGVLDAANVPSSAAIDPPPNAESTAPIAAQQGGVIKHPDPAAPFDARWTWAMEQANRRGVSDDVAIGWRVRSAINDGAPVISSTDGTSRSPGRSVAETLGMPRDERGVAILLTWSGGAKGELSAVRLRDMKSSVVLRDGPFLWLHSADDAASIALIQQLMATQQGSSVRSELGAALTLHDDRAQVMRAVTRVLETERDAHVRGETIAWMGNRARDSAVVALLRRAVDDSAAEVRDEAVSALGGARDGRGRTVLLELLTSAKHADVRGEVVQQLAGGGDDVVAVLLRVAFDDPADDVQSEAVDAIKETSGAAATQALRDIAQRHPQRRLRSEARDALDERGIR